MEIYYGQDQNSDCNTAMTLAPEGNRRRGPNTTWNRTVKKERSEAGWQLWEEVKTVAAYREKWRDFVEALHATWHFPPLFSRWFLVLISLLLFPSGAQDTAMLQSSRCFGPLRPLLPLRLHCFTSFLMGFMSALCSTSSLLTWSCH